MKPAQLKARILCRVLTWVIVGKLILIAVRGVWKARSVQVHSAKGTWLLKRGKRTDHGL